jgi:hypothetical protein
MSLQHNQGNFITTFYKNQQPTAIVKEANSEQRTANSEQRTANFTANI